MKKNKIDGGELVKTAKKVEVEDLYPLIQEVLNAGGTFKLTVTGSSMSPFLGSGRDQVTISPIPSMIRKNDVLFYRRRSGQFILHRVVKVCKDGTYTCCGDRQYYLEKGLERDQMIGVVTEFVRKGRHFTNRNIFYRMYRTVWTWLFPLRPYIFAVRSKIGGTQRKDKNQ